MRIAFFVNGVETEEVVYTTTRLALSSLRRGHEIWYIGAENFSYGADGSIYASAVAPPGSRYKSERTFLEALQGAEAVRERIDVGSLDVLMLRNDPSEEAVERPWAQNVGILFGQAAVERGVLVVNDPTGLSRALNKMYLQLFPEEVRPHTLISRDPAEIREFIGTLKGNAVLKPLQGSGGESVFLVREDEAANLNQIIDAVSRRGYVIAQDFIPDASREDTRLFLLNGEPLRVEGKVAAFRRIARAGDLRTNMSSGGGAQRAKLTDRHFELAEIVRPRLIEDGMFLVGLDIAGGQILEINVFSPGGLGTAGDLEKTDFTEPVLDALERKVGHVTRYGPRLENARLAVL